MSDINTRTIYFEPARSEKLEFSGESGLHNLLQLGALLLTNKVEYVGDERRTIYLTDKDGFQILESELEKAVDSLMKDLYSLGQVLDYMDPDEMGHNITNIGGLIAGIADIARVLNTHLHDLRIHRQQ